MQGTCVDENFVAWAIFADSIQGKQRPQHKSYLTICLSTIPTPAHVLPLSPAGALSVLEDDSQTPVHVQRISAF